VWLWGQPSAPSQGLEVEAWGQSDQACTPTPPCSLLLAFEEDSGLSASVSFCAHGLQYLQHGVRASSGWHTQSAWAVPGGGGQCLAVVIEE
jgi:hypothetical protein